MTALVLAVLCAGCHRKTEAEWDKEHFDKQVASIRNGKSDCLYLYDLQEPDALLRGVAGMKEIKGIMFDQMYNVTALGMEAVSTLPNLKTVTIGGVKIGDDLLQALSGSPSLEKLNLSPYLPPTINVETLLAFPRLKKLCIDLYMEDNDEGKAETEAWVKNFLEQMKEATSLDELILSGSVFVDRRKKVALLQKQLPGCKIKLVRGIGATVGPSLPLEVDL